MITRAADSGELSIGIPSISAAPTVGIDARIALTEHLSRVPGLHACVFRFSDDSGLLVRPRIGVRWAF